MVGRVESIKESKYFGFIRCNGTSFFFHKDDFTGHWDDLVMDHYKEGNVKVEFDPVKTEKGMRAINVKRLDFPNQAV